MFKYSLAEIISFLKCIHNVEEHKEDIKYNVKIIVSEYILRGRGREDLREAITVILSQDINIFPFPKDVKTREEREAHIKNRNLDGQFQGIYNFLEKEPISQFFYVKIYGTSWSKNMQFCFKDVTFRSKQHKIFDAIRKEKPSFFNDRQKFIVASIKVNSHSHSIALQQVRNKVREELNHISIVLDRDLIVDGTNNYLVSFDEIKLLEAWSTDKFHKTFTKEIIPSLEDTPHFFLRQFENEARNHLLNFEYLIVNAKKQGNVVNYWHYLETLLELGNNHKEVEEVVATISILEEKNLRKRILHQTLYSSFNMYNFPLKELDLSYDDLKNFQTFLKKGTMPKEVKHIKYPFIKELLQEHNKQMNLKFHKTSKAFYRSILRESYEQRNFFQHQAVANQKAIIKLQHTLPYIVQRFRWPIFDEIKKHSTITFPDLINILVERGNKIAK